MVMVLDAKVADTPSGKPFAPDTPLFDMPIAPVVAMVILVNGVLMHKVGEVDGVPTVFTGVTVMVPVALTLPQPPVNGML